MKIVYKRNGEKNTVSVTPEKNDSGYYLIGITSSNYVKTNVFETAAYSAYNVKYWINLTIDSLKQLVTGRIGVDQLSGPVGIVSAVDTTYKESKSGGALLIFLNLLQMTILLSANLGVMNLLPLPALDGGRLVFLIVEFTGSSQNTMHMLDCGAAFTPMIIQGGEYYRLFTCMFLHFGIEHLLNNMLVLFVLGSRLEQVIGKIKFLLIYLIGGVLGNVISLLIELRTQDFAVSAGASGAVFAVMGAMIYIVIRNKGWLGDLSMRQILVMAAFSLYFGFASTGVDNTAHVGGMVSGFFLAVIFYHPGRKI